MTNPKSFDQMVRKAQQNPKAFMNQSIHILLKAFKKSYAEKKFHQSCEVLITCGACGGKRCENCPLHQTFTKVCENLDNPVIQQSKYDIWRLENAINNERNGHIYNDGKHTTRVMR